MKLRRKSPLPSILSTLLAPTLALSQAGCVISSTEVISTDRVYLLGPKTESEPGTFTRDVTTRAVDTKGTIAFHVDRARECNVTSTPRFQRVHVEGNVAKNVAGAAITGSLLVAGGAGLIVGPTVATGEDWFEGESSGGSSSGTLTGVGYLGFVGISLAIAGLVVLPRAIYHAVASGTTVTPGEVELGVPPAGAVRAPVGYDPNKPQVKAMIPRMEQPQYGILAFGAKPAEQMDVSLPWSAAPWTSLRSERDFDRATAAERAGSAPADPALMAIPDSSDGGASDRMKECVAKYSPSCQAKCGSDKSCLIACLRKPCVEDDDSGSSEDGRDEYTNIIKKTEVCERSADGGTIIALTVKDIDGVPRTIDIGKTNGGGDVKKDILAGLEGVYPGWPDIKQAILQEAQVVLVEDPTVVLGKLDLGKYPGLKYAEHIVSTKKQREALALVEQQRKEREAKEKQAQLEAAAKAADDALHADERKAEAAKKAQACMAQHQSKCSADCQGNSACVKKCMQRMPACK